MNFEDMSVEELEAYRDDLQKQIEDLRGQFVAAGRVLEVKRSGISVQDAIEAAQREVVRLQKLQSTTEVTKTGNK